MIFLDKRDNSSFDYLTVSETAHEPPQMTAETDEINHPDKLSLEATMINQHFTQQVLLFDADDNRKTVRFDFIQSYYLKNRQFFWENIIRFRLSAHSFNENW